MRKDMVVDSLADMPEEFTLDEIVERLIIIDKINKGRQQIKDGKINTEEEAAVKLSKWLS